MKLRPVLAAIFFCLLNVPTLVRSQAVFDTTNNPLTAQDYDTGDYTFSLSDLGPLQSSSSVNVPGQGQVTLAAGTNAADLFTVGQLNTFGFTDLSLDQISAATQLPLAQTPLSQFPFLQTLTVSQLVQSIPGLDQTPWSEVAPIQALVQQQGIAVLGTTVGEIAPQLQGTIGQLGDQLGNFSVTQIPGLSGVSLGQLPGINLAKIADIPGLSQFPLFNPLSIKDWFVPFDIPFGMSECKIGGDCHEHNIDNTASGNAKNMAIPCMGGAKQSCAHIEVRRNFINPTQHIRWISKEQKVSGGSGLGSAICDKEPTGRFPLGLNPKVVLEKIDEKAGKIEFALYFSVHVDLDESDSAHCVGPFPMPVFGSAKEKQLILFGPDNVPPNSPFASMASSMNPQSCTAPTAQPVSATSGSSPTNTYKGVDLNALKGAISNVESLGTGGYQAIGSYIDNDGAGNHGRALGKYQFMSYGPARDIILQKPGGRAFLNQIDSPYTNIAQMQPQVTQFFTSQEQETLMDSQVKQLIDIAQSQGYSGDKLIQRVAQMHNGGIGAAPGSSAKYSSDVLTSYKSGGGSSATAGAPCSGSPHPVVPTSCDGTQKLYQRPAQGPLTSPYGWRLDPILNRWRIHAGQDIGATYGSPVVAADCGVVINIAGTNESGGYGNMIKLKHPDGNITLYGHLSQFNVMNGAQVLRGQVIGLVGSTGFSTGPHLHFEVHPGGNAAVNPVPYVAW